MTTTNFFKCHKNIFLLFLALTIGFSASAQIDYTTIIKNRKAAFYRADQYQSLRLDLENTDELLLITYQTFSTKDYPEVDIDAIIQRQATTARTSTLEASLSSDFKSNAQNSQCILTDFSGVQNYKMNQPVQKSYRTLTGSAGAMVVKASEATVFLALKSEPNTQMVINVLQVRDVTAADLEWNESKVQGIVTDCMKTATEEYDAEVCDCIKYYVPQKETYMHYSHLDHQYRTELINEYYNQCVREYNKMQIASSSAVIEKKVDALLKIGEQQWKNGEYENFQKTYLEILNKGRIDDGIYTKLAESYFIMKDYEEFKKNTYLALGTNKYNLFAQGKLIRILLLENNFDKAMEVYKKHRGNRLPNNMTFRSYMKEDIDFTMSMGYVNENVKKFQQAISGI